MKYYNKTKRVREYWTMIDMPTTLGEMYRLKKWCQRADSRKRFFVEYRFNDGHGLSMRTAIVYNEQTSLLNNMRIIARWWFEDKEDATVFKLMNKSL